MSRDTTVIPFRQPDAIDDPLSELAREGARRMLAQVLVAEADAFVAMWKDLKLPDGRDRVVRHGHGPRRAIQTRVGPVEVRRAKVRDRGAVGAEEKIRFTPGRVVRRTLQRQVGDRTLQRQVGDRKSVDYCMTIVPNSAGNSCLQTGLCRMRTESLAAPSPRCGKRGRSSGIGSVRSDMKLGDHAGPDRCLGQTLGHDQPPAGYRTVLLNFARPNGIYPGSAREKSVPSIEMGHFEAQLGAAASVGGCATRFRAAFDRTASGSTLTFPSLF